MGFVEVVLFAVYFELGFYEPGKFAVACYAVAPAAVVYFAFVGVADLAPYFVGTVGEGFV